MRRPHHELYHAVNGEFAKGEIIYGDAIEFLKRLPRQSARIVFLDPPFNLGKTYNPGKVLDHMPVDQYREWLESVISESAEVLEPGGSLFLYHLPLWGLRLGNRLEEKLTFRQWIAISMKNGFVRGTRLYPAHYALLMFSNGKPKRFVRPRISPQECRTCGALIKDYGGYRSIIQKKGVNLSDVWDDLSPVRHAHTKNRPANELPSLLFHRILTMVGGRGALYVDPFGGSGSGVVAAASRGMRFATCDIVRANCALIKRRVEELTEDFNRGSNK